MSLKHALSLLLIALSAASCSLHQGQRATQTPGDLYLRGIDMERRGDLVAAHTLFIRLEAEFPGSTYTLLASLKRMTWPVGAVDRAHASKSK